MKRTGRLLLIIVGLSFGCEEPPSVESGMSCADGVDNDGNGQTDCADPECAEFCVLLDAALIDVPIQDGGAGGDDVGDVGGCSECEDGFICNSMTGACTAIETPCQIADCQANQATSCDGVFSLSCGTVGGECANFIDPNDVPFQWCSCGDLAEGTGTCTGDNAGIDCDGGVAVPFTCPVGSLCLDAGSEGTLCICDDADDGVCPDEGCVDDVDCGGCVPSCGSRACGANGCGGDCGGCGLGEVCTDVGTCQGCAPSCDGRSCGADRCGGVCGRCGGDESCDDEGQCRSDCMPSCTVDQTCGSDGCGGVCGTCPAGEICSASDICERSCFFENTTYTFDASALDWSNTNYVALRARQLRGDGSYTGWQHTTIARGASTSATLSFAGACTPNIEVERSYSMRGGVRCDEGPETITTQTISIPPATLTGDTCDAPAL